MGVQDKIGVVKSEKLVLIVCWFAVSYFVVQQVTMNQKLEQLF